MNQLMLLLQVVTLALLLYMLLRPRHSENMRENVHGQHMDYQAPPRESVNADF